MSWAFPRDLEAPAKISRVAFDIEPAKDGAVCLTVTHDELESGSEMVKGITRGWPMVLSSLKSLIETGKVFDRPDMVKKHAES